MAFVVKDRVQEYAMVIGTGAVPLGTSPVLGYLPFSRVMNVGDTTWYCIVDAVAGVWEVGVGTFAAGVTLQRTQVLANSSGGTSLIVFAGINQCSVFMDLPASFIAGLDTGTNIGRNRIDNGWMEIQQRGAGPFTTNNGYTADRWMVGNTGTGTVTTNVVAATGYGPARYVLETTSPVAAGYALQFMQRIESATAFDLVGQTVTVSFYGSATTTGGTIQGQIVLGYPSVKDNFSGTMTYLTAANVTLTGTPGRVTATFTNLPTGVMNGLQVNFVVAQSTAAGTVAFNISGAQLEVGSIASLLEKRPFATELERCQRYFQMATLWGTGYAATATPVGIAGYLAVTMRTTPTVATTTSADTGLGTLTVGALSGGTVYAQATTTATGSYNFNVAVTATADL